MKHTLLIAAAIVVAAMAAGGYRAVAQAPAGNYVISAGGVNFAWVVNGNTGTVSFCNSMACKPIGNAN